MDGRSEDGPGRELAAALSAAEIGVYGSLRGIETTAACVEATARKARLAALERRARLLRSDLLSRTGELQSALAMQLALLATSEHDGDRATSARAHCLLASTYDRLGDASMAQTAAEAAVRLLADEDPPHWRVEHMMVLALFTGQWQHAGTDRALFDEALRLARSLDDPVLLVAVLNNYAWVMLEDEQAARAVPLVDELETVVATRLGGQTSSAVLDTIALGLLSVGRLDDAERIIGAAVDRSSSEVEPHSLPCCLLTAAEIRRRRADLAGAERLLQRARTESQARGTPEVAARALRSLARVAAERGEHDRAYEQLDAYLQEWEALRSERGERHAAMLRAVYGARAERERRLELEGLVARDPLTGLWNRRHLERRLPQLIGRCRESGDAISVALLDLDHFKAVNDRHSHAAGDRVLQRFAGLIEAGASEASAESFAARLGGEEFVVVLAGLDASKAVTVCERLCAQLRASDWSDLDPALAVTASVGIATDHGAATASSLLSGADEQLYRAKREGRDRVACGPPRPSPSVGVLATGTGVDSAPRHTGAAAPSRR